MRAEKLEALLDGAEVYLKLENFQYTGSFKIRGVSNKILSLSEEELSRGVTAASSGSHMAKIMGIPATIVMPVNAPKVKIAGAKANGAEVVLCGYTGEDRDRKCEELIKEHGFSLVHSHVDPYVITGHGTCAVEAWEQMEGEMTDLVIPCGPPS